MVAESGSPWLFWLRQLFKRPQRFRATTARSAAALHGARTVLPCGVIVRCRNSTVASEAFADKAGHAAVNPIMSHKLCWLSPLETAMAARHPFAEE